MPGRTTPRIAWCTRLLLASSMMTDNGLSTADYAQWPAHTIFLLLSASFFCGCVGSTCGGIKALRFLIMFKQSIQEMNQLAHPRALLSIKVGKSVVNERVLRSVWSFFFLYVMITGFFCLVAQSDGLRPVHRIRNGRRLHQQHGAGVWGDGVDVGTLTEGAKLLMCAAMIWGVWKFTRC